MMQRTAKKQEIDQHPTATQEEKDARKAKVDAEVQKRKMQLLKQIQIMM